MDSLHIVFAGTRATDALKKQIEEKGGHVHIGLTKKTTLLVVKETARGSKKIEEARAKGIAVKSLEDFLATYSLSLEPKRGQKREESKAPKQSAKTAEEDEAEAEEEAEDEDEAAKAANAAEVESLKQAIASHNTLVKCLAELLEQKVTELKTMREKLSAMS
jgi:BRCA1 C Terminus (BRCT) domain